MLQSYDSRNENIWISVGGKLVQREEAKISVFDSAVQGGDAVWEGLRVYQSGIFCLDKHIDRLLESAHALSFSDIPTGDEVRKAIFQTLNANQMRDNTHIRLTLTRGKKITSGMDPRLNQSGPCLIVLAEWKAIVYDNVAGISVITSSQRRNGPQFLDSKIHHNNLLNNIIAKIQANVAGVDAALMLDERGFVAELNDTNVFMVKHGKVFTPHADACLPGITRGLIIDLCNQLDIHCEEKNISLTELYNADEVFASGTMGEITPIHSIDGRKIGRKHNLSFTSRIQEAFHALIPNHSEPIPF